MTSSAPRPRLWTYVRTNERTYGRLIAFNKALNVLTSLSHTHRETSTRTHLPDGVGVLAGLSRTNVDRAGAALNQVVNGHVAVVESDGDQVRKVRIDVHGHHSAVRRIDVFRERRILERVEQDHTRLLLQKLVCNVILNGK